MLQTKWLGMLAVLFGISTVSAAPLVSVEGSASCPTPAQVEAAVAPFSETPRAGRKHYRLVVSNRPVGSASLRLYRLDGTLAFERVIHSDDCESLAEAFAIIVKAHFLSLGFELPQAQVPKQSGASIDSRNTQPTQEKRSSADLAPAAKAGAPHPAPSGPDRPAAPWRVALGMAAGGRLDGPERLTAAMARVELEALAEPLVLRVGLGVDMGATTSTEPRVRRQSSEALVSAGYRWGRDWWLEQYLGVGVAMARARATQVVDRGTVTSWTPVGSLGLRGGFTDPRWGAWLDLSALALVKRDRYLVDPVGNVGLGPRWQVRALVGVQFAW